MNVLNIGMKVVRINNHRGLMGKIYLFVLLIVFPMQMFAQGIRGVVIDDEAATPLYLANVVLLRLSDSVFVEGTVTNEIGEFSFSSVDKGKYKLQVSYLGYTTLSIPVVAEDVGILRLAAMENDLSEVVVVGMRTLVKAKSDGVAVEVENSYLGNLGVATDVLEQLPFVRRNEDRFIVFGKGAPLIYIDNREVRDLSELEALNSNEIKRVEVVTNPGIRYKASAKSVIRIETVRKKGEGLSGSLYAYGAMRRHLFGSGQGSLNYRWKNLDLFGSLDYSEQRREQNIDWNQGIENPGLKSSVLESIKRDLRQRNLSLKLGTNYTWGESNSLGMRYEYNKAPRGTTHMRNLTHVFENEVLLGEQSSEQGVRNKSDQHSINAYYRGKLTSWLEVAFDMDWSEGKSNSTQEVKKENVRDEQELRTVSKQDYDLFAMRLQLETSLGKWGNLSYGGELSCTNNQQDFVVDRSFTDDFQTEYNLSDQKLFAVYVAYMAEVGCFSFDAEVRLENADFSYFENDVKQKEQSKEYLNWFPNLGVSFSKNDFTSAISFSRSISRPSYYQLRNSIQYNSAYSYEAGNPYLKPSIDNMFSGSIGWRDLLFSINFDVYKDAMLLISKPYSEQILLSTFENVKNYKNLSASFFYSWIVNIWKPSVSVGVSKDIFSYGSSSVDYDKPIYSFSWKNNFVLPRGWQFGLDLSYSTEGHMEMDYMGDVFLWNAYVSKRFLGDRLRVNLRATDLLATGRAKTYMRIDNIYRSLYNDLDSRRVSLSISYYFNTVKSKYKGKEVGSDEKRRLLSF
ncbi:TonB-dependent receptor [Parabacteroides distasonis]|uniref:TonB-dependent receptor n=2 Tax=Parabacteroides distasonis TaxID=823 RepID=A0A3L7ZIW5_PARDI|nr:TonB-dependent receptor [Parabacteroides distasonis]RLT71786.1 TonB-dependent receptor [Parabacteroides distasonis]